MATEKTGETGDKLKKFGQGLWGKAKKIGGEIADGASELKDYTSERFSSISTEALDKLNAALANQIELKDDILTITLNLNDDSKDNEIKKFQIRPDEMRLFYIEENTVEDQPVLLIGMAKIDGDRFEACEWYLDGTCVPFEEDKEDTEWDMIPLKLETSEES